MYRPRHTKRASRNAADREESGPIVLRACRTRSMTAAPHNPARVAPPETATMIGCTGAVLAPHASRHSVKASSSGLRPAAELSMSRTVWT